MNDTRQANGSPRTARRAVLRAGTAALGLLILTGCSTFGYYLQSVGGHMSLMAARKPIETVIVNPVTPEETRRKLQLAVQARAFAARELGLPDNGSYLVYSHVGRDYLVWNVFATPEFSLEPEEWCFPLVGCLTYRGYFRESAALSYADDLRARQLDVYVGGVVAYSTLGWFDDPVVSTMLTWEDHRLVKVIMHELAHQRLYVAGDTDFNEAFAEFVAAEGMRRWLLEPGNAHHAAAYARAEAQERALIELALDTRARLDALYRSEAAPDMLRAAKAEVLAGMQRRYAAAAEASGGQTGYERWVMTDLNNAKLSSVATYHRYVPAFERLFELSGNDLGIFYAQASELGRLTETVRRARMAALARGGGAEVAGGR